MKKKFLIAVAVLTILLFGVALGGAGSDTSTPPTPPTVRLEPYTPPATIAEILPNGWTDELLAEAHAGFASGYGDMDEFGECIFWGLVETFTPDEFVDLSTRSAEEIEAVLAPWAEYCR